MPNGNTVIPINQIALCLLVLALLIAMGAVQAKIRNGEAIAGVLRFASLIPAALAGGITGKAMIDSWYLSNAAPSLEWKGALWIGAIFVSAVTIVVLMLFVSATPCTVLSMPSPKTKSSLAEEKS